MSEELKRRLVGAAVLLFVFSLVAWWVGSQDDQSGELPAADAQVRNYDIRELDRIAAAQQGQQPEQEPVPDITAEPDYEEGVETVVPEEPVVQPVVPEAEEVKPEPEVKPAPVVEQEPAKKEVKPAAKQTETSSNKPATDANGAWVVQVASVTHKPSAEALASRLKAKGWQSFLTEAIVSGKNYYRVRVGPYAQRDKAEEAAKSLKKELGQDVAVLAK